MEKENREYKDTVFCDLFYVDRDAKKNLLELYNALYDTDYTDPEIIDLVRLEDVLYMSFKNDVAFSVKDQKIVLNEHQSTINPNMPLRDLLYIGREYEKILVKGSQFRRTLVKIPKPVFYTFYNGTKNYPLETELHLKDAFQDPGTDSEPSLDLTVKVININADKNHPLLSRCQTLREYSQFVEITRKHKNNKESLKEAIKECMSKGILKDYLERKGSEVINMLMDEYSYEEDIAVQRQEAEEVGEIRGIKIGEIQGIKIGEIRGEVRGEKKQLMKLVIRKLKKSLSLAEIADSLEEPVEEILPLVKLAEKYAPEYDEEVILKALTSNQTKVENTNKH